MELALFDIRDTLVKDPVDAASYIEETLRNVFGLDVNLDMQKYYGKGTMEIIWDVLSKNNISKEELKSKPDLLADDLYYSYYNFAWRGSHKAVDGAHELLRKLSEKGILLGLASTETEKISRFKLEQTGISTYFKVAAYGDEAETIKEIAKLALERARKQQSIEKVFFIANSVLQVKASLELGIIPIGIASKVNETELKNAGAKEVVKSLSESSKIMNLITKG